MANKKHDFNVGDIVRYLNNSYTMTVKSYSKKGIRCFWFDKQNDLHEATFCADKLKHETILSSGASQVGAANRRQTSRRAPSNLLQTAESLIYGARNKTYRHPTENFENIANLQNAYLKAIARRGNTWEEQMEPDGNIHRYMKINKIDVAYMNILQKIARGATNQEHEDTIVDIAGYAGCIERIVKNK